MDWSLQLYSARNFQPWNAVLQTLAEAGYTQVEGFGGLYADPEAFRAELDGYGLSMPSGHFSLDMLENEAASARRIAGTLGMKLMVCPYVAVDQRPTDVEGWKAFGRRLRRLGETYGRDGMLFAWHNHEFEFAPLPDGSTPMKHILEAAPQIGIELDVAWVIRGGADPSRFIADHGDRIVAVHVKDIAAPGQALDEDGWSDVGHGTVDWVEIMKRIRERTPARLFVMEHDKPSDLTRFARRSIAACRNF